MVGRLLLSIFPLLAVASQLSYKVSLKKGNEVLSVYSEGSCRVIEKNPRKEEGPLFSHFRVVKEGNGLLIEWKPSDPSVEKVVIITDRGRFLESQHKRIRLVLKGEKLISVYPVADGGVWGFPATVRLGG